jgi:hypothetical protein
MAVWRAKSSPPTNQVICVRCWIAQRSV